MREGRDVHFAVQPHVQHGVERVHDIVHKHVVAPRAAVAMDAASAGGERNAHIDLEDECVVMAEESAGVACVVMVEESAGVAHFCPRSNLKMNFGITFSGNWQGPNTLLPRVIKTGKL